MLIVLAVSAALVYPKLDGLLMNEPEPWHSGRRLVRVAEYAHGFAVTTESMLSLEIDPRTGAYRVIDRNGNEDARAALNSLGLRGRLSADVEVSQVELLGEPWLREEPFQVRLSPDGWCDSCMICLTSSDGGVVRVVIGEWLGNIQIVDAGWAQ